MAKIAAVVTTQAGGVAGGAPIFVARDRAEMQKTAFLLEKMLDCSAHELAEHLFVLIDHRQPDG